MRAPFLAFSVLLLTACGSPQLEGVYRVDEVTDDACGIADDAVGATVGLSLYIDDDNVRYGIHDQEIGLSVPWVSEGLFCIGGGEDPVGFGCIPDDLPEDPAITVTGAVFAREGEMTLWHEESDCVSELRATWDRRFPNNEGVLVAPY